MLSSSGCLPTQSNSFLPESLGSLAPSKQTGISKVNLNVRQKPSTKGKRIGQLTKGQKLEINDTDGNWYHITSTSGAPLTGWVSGKYVTKTTTESSKASASKSKQVAGTSKTGKNPFAFLDNLFDVKKEGNNYKISVKSAQSMKDVKNGVSYLGYSQDYHELRKLIYRGQRKKAIAHYENDTGAQLKDNIPLIDMESGSLKTLHNMDLGVLRLEAGDTANAMEHFSTSLRELELEESEGIITSMFSTSGRWILGKTSGDEEFLPYDPDGYEKVMLLNYKAIAYLLEGKDEAFNVARRATTWQSEERQKFDEEIEEANNSLKSEKNKLNKSTSKDNSPLPFLPVLNSGFAEIGKHFSKSEKYAKKVPSAYVNPFSDYLRGAVMEYYSQVDDSNIDDAFKAYREASRLNPDSKLLKKAAKELELFNDDPSKMPNGNLLHVVLADGFAPEKKVYTYVLPIPDAIIPVRLTTLARKKSSATSFKLICYSPTGRTTTTFDQIADISAMSYRYQADSMVKNNLELITSIGMSYIKQRAGGYFGGSLGMMGALMLESFAHPDTRTWTTLPSKFLAARLKVPKGTKNVTIISYGADGKQLASKKIAINPNGHNFIYGRSINSRITAQASENLWVNNY